MHAKRERIDNVFKGGGKSWTTFFQTVQCLTLKYSVASVLMQVTYQIILSLNDGSRCTFEISQKTNNS